MVQPRELAVLPPPRRTPRTERVSAASSMHPPPRASAAWLHFGLHAIHDQRDEAWSGREHLVYTQSTARRLADLSNAVGHGRKQRSTKNVLFTPKSYTFCCESHLQCVTSAVNRHHKTERAWRSLSSRSYLQESERLHVGSCLLALLLARPLFALCHAFHALIA